MLLGSITALAWKPWPLPMDSADRALDTLLYHGSWSGVAATGSRAPFWFSANTSGAVSTRPLSTLLRGGISKPAVRPARWWDYSYGVDLVGGVEQMPQKRSGCIVTPSHPALYGRIVELYAHARLWCFDFTVGWKPLDAGNHDYELSSGGMIMSRNAPSIPRISIGIDRYTAFPFTYGYLEIKGNVTHGWFTDGIGVKNTLLHYKHIGVRLGGKLPVNISYEFHHAAQWGGVSEVYGDLGSSLASWWNIFKAGAGGKMANDQMNAEGNHMGSQMVGLDVKFPDWKISAWWQNIFEDGPILPIWKTMNVYDGLWGISIRQQRWPFISGVVYELFHTTDQSGPAHDIDGIVFGGADSYYINGIYYQGWNHYMMTVGNPFITSPVYNTGTSLFTENNRTTTHHVAIQGDIYGFRYRAHYSHSRNLGRYSAYRASENNGFLLEVHKVVPQAWGLDFGLSLGADFGTQFGNSFGAMVTVAKRGIAWKSKR